MLASIDKRWLTASVVDLSNTIYRTRDVDKLPILADALADAGCDDYELLEACRTMQEPEEFFYTFLEIMPRPHTRHLFPETNVTRLMPSITRRRPRGSGNRRQLALRLANLLHTRALKLWMRLTKDQRATKVEASALLLRVQSALDSVQAKCKERLITYQEILNVIQLAERDGSGYYAADHTVAGCYGYPVSYSYCRATRTVEGNIRLIIGRRVSGANDKEIVAPAAQFRKMLKLPEPT